jgi:O-antigen/teichoic acid export membrane protein
MDSESPETSSLTPPVDEDLRGTVVRGGLQLMIRQGAGLILSVGTVLVLTRVIGPAGYGLFSAVFGIAFFAQATGELSLDVYIVRFPRELTREVCDQVFTLLVVLAGITTLLLIGATPALALLVKLRGFDGIAIAMFASIPLMHMQQVHLSRMERALDYRRVGVVELGAQVAYALVALPLAFVLKDAWAPVFGWWVQQLFLLLGFWHADRYRPRLSWKPKLVRDALRYGVATNASNVVYSMRSLVVTVFVSRVLGASGVGYVSLAIRLAQQLGFVQAVMLRISIAVLGKIADDRERLRRAMTQGAELQLLAQGVPITLFSLVASVLVPVIFGRAWTPVAHLIPLLAPAYMAMAMFSTVSAAMWLGRRPRDLLLTQGSSAALLWLGSVIFIPHYGIQGYGYGELVAMGSWLVANVLLARHMPRPRYRIVFGWWVSLAAASLAPVTSWWVLCVCPLGLAAPGSIAELRRVVDAALPARWRGRLGIV